MNQPICDVNDLEDPGARGYELGEHAILIVRRGDQVRAFINACPHRGIRLEWQPDQFLDYEKQYIQCSTHGALFTLDEGKCIVGPCNGKSLQAINCRVEEGKVWVSHSD